MTHELSHASSGMVTLVTMFVLLAEALCIAGEAPDAHAAQRFDVNHPATFAPAFKDKAEWEAHAEVVRQQAMVALGLFPLPPETPLNPVIHSKIERDGYTVEKVFFASLPGHYVSGNLYRPTGKAEGKRPGVLCPHGHWANGRFYENSEANAKKDVASGAEKT